MPYTQDVVQPRRKSFFNPLLFEEKVETYSQSILKRFRTITRTHSLFHLFFFLLCLLEIFAFISFFSFFTHTTILAFTLAGFLLTAFSYLILLFYFQAKKPQQFQELHTVFVEKCRTLIPHGHGSSKHHLSVAHALYKLVTTLHAQEYFYYPTPSRWATTTSVIQKLSSWSHWRDLHKMKELLVQSAIQEHYELIKNAPTDIEAHASLAQAYLLLSRLYLNPRKLNPDEDLPWVPKEYSSEEMLEKLSGASRRAIEEFKIVDSFSPNDPWVHTQLAAIYRDLEMTKEEITTNEKLLNIAPKDPDILLRLGTLYFIEGHHAKGLTIYDKLLKDEDPRADELIAHYGTLFSSEEEH